MSTAAAEIALPVSVAISRALIRTVSPITVIVPTVNALTPLWLPSFLVVSGFRSPLDPSLS